MVPLNKERKILFICGVVLLLAGVIYRFSSNIPAVFTGSDEVSIKEKELMKYREVLQDKRRLEAALVSAERELARTEAGLLPQGTPTLAAVDIQKLIKDVAEQKKVTIHSMRPLKSNPTENGEYITVPVDVNITATTRQMTELLYAIDHSQKLLEITSIRVRSPNIGRDEKINCTFTVQGLMKNDENVSN